MLAREWYWCEDAKGYEQGLVLAEQQQRKKRKRMQLCLHAHNHEAEQQQQQQQKAHCLPTLNQQLLLLQHKEMLCLQSHDSKGRAAAVGAEGAVERSKGSAPTARYQVELRSSIRPCNPAGWRWN